MLHRDFTAIKEAQQILEGWLVGMGLELKPSKTRITHTLTPYNGNVGFDFLGFQVRQFPVGKAHSGKDQRRNLLGFKTIIQPSQDAVRKHSQAIRSIIHKHRNAPQTALIARLNPLIRGWTNYYACVASKKSFSKMKNLTYIKLRRWAKRRHPNQNWNWVMAKYWRLETGYWLFGTKEGHRLYGHQRRPIIRHAKVQHDKSPYDGDWVYWATRLGRYPQLPKRPAILLNRQEGKCTWCGLYFKQEDLLEIDHILPTAHGGRDGYQNWQLLHRHCHDEKTATDRAIVVEGTNDKSQSTEEPGAPKGARPVLKPSERSDPIA